MAIEFRDVWRPIKHFRPNEGTNNLLVRVDGGKILAYCSYSNGTFWQGEDMLLGAHAWAYMPDGAVMLFYNTPLNADLPIEVVYTALVKELRNAQEEIKSLKKEKDETIVTLEEIIKSYKARYEEAKRIIKSTAGFAKHLDSDEL